MYYRENKEFLKLPDLWQMHWRLQTWQQRQRLTKWLQLSDACTRHPSCRTWRSTRRICRHIDSSKRRSPRPAQRGPWWCRKWRWWQPRRNAVKFLASVVSTPRRWWPEAWACRTADCDWGWPEIRHSSWWDLGKCEWWCTRVASHVR